MKRFAIYMTALLALTGLFAFGLDQPSAGAITNKDARACYKAYNGHGTGRGTDGKFNTQMSKKYNKSKCDAAKDGNCSINDSSQGAIVTCKKTWVADEDTTDTTGDCGEERMCDPALREATCNEDNCDIVENFVNPLISLLTVVVGLAITIGIIYGSILISTSAGDPQRNANGKKHIQNAVLALISFVLLWAFLQWVVPGGYL